MTAPDVPASSLRRRAGELAPEAARLRFVILVAPDPHGRCQLCGASAAEQPLVVLEPVIDWTNGQRITIALCRPCCGRALEVADHTVMPQRRRGRRR